MRTAPPTVLPLPELLRPPLRGHEDADGACRLGGDSADAFPVGADAAVAHGAEVEHFLVPVLREEGRVREVLALGGSLLPHLAGIKVDLPGTAYIALVRREMAIDPSANRKKEMWKERPF